MLNNYQKKYGIEKKETASVGDSHIDGSMFAQSSIGILFNHLNNPKNAGNIPLGATHTVTRKDLRNILKYII